MDRLRFGTFLAPNIMPVYQAVTEEVGRRLGIETELVVETDYEACAKDENEVCFVCSLPYVEFERQGIARVSRSPRRCSRATAMTASPSTSRT
jgi:ABC-type phosphate/phosphonate transport system substrate-binding protein